MFHAAIQRPDLLVDFIPQAIFAVDIAYFSQQNFPIVEGEDDLDHFRAVFIATSSDLQLAIKHYSGFPKGTCSLYIDGEIRDVDEITAIVDSVMSFFDLPAGTLHWQRRDGLSPEPVAPTSSRI